jgi:hypothetical protein
MQIFIFKKLVKNRIWIKIVLNHNTAIDYVRFFSTEYSMHNYQLHYFSNNLHFRKQMIEKSI